MDITAIISIMSGVAGGAGGFWLALVKLRQDAKKTEIDASTELHKSIFALVAELQEERKEMQDTLDNQRARISQLKKILADNNIAIPD